MILENTTRKDDAILSAFEDFDNGGLLNVVEKLDDKLTDAYAEIERLRKIVAELEAELEGKVEL